MAMSRKLWSINGLAVELDRDRRVVADAVGHLPPDGESAGRPAWFMSTAVRALTVGGENDGLLDPAQERARKDRALAEQTEMKNAVTRGELVNFEEVERDARWLFTSTRERLLAVPVEVQTDLPESCAQIAHDAVKNRLFAALDELAADGDAATLEVAEWFKSQKSRAKQRRQT